MAYRVYRSDSLSGPLKLLFELDEPGRYDPHADRRRLGQYHRGLLGGIGAGQLDAWTEAEVCGATRAL